MTFSIPSSSGVCCNGKYYRDWHLDMREFQSLLHQGGAAINYGGVDAEYITPEFQSLLHQGGAAMSSRFTARRIAPQPVSIPSSSGRCCNASTSTRGCSLLRRVSIPSSSGRCCNAARECKAWPLYESFNPFFIREVLQSTRYMITATKNAGFQSLLHQGGAAIGSLRDWKPGSLQGFNPFFIREVLQSGWLHCYSDPLLAGFNPFFIREVLQYCWSHAGWTSDRLFQSLLHQGGAAILL